MTGKIIDYALVIWCIMRDFLRCLTENRHIPFPTLVTNPVEAVRIRGSGREKRVLPRLGPIINKTEEKAEPLPQGLSQHSPHQLFLGLHRRLLLV